MRRLKLQVQISVDGFVAGPNGEMDWMAWNWDEALKGFVSDLTSSVDCILLGRKMTDGFINHWEKVASNPDDPEYLFGKKFTDTPKVVFTKTLERSVWNNTVLAKGNIVDEVNTLKERPGSDIIVYGGAGFVSSLVSHNLIDEYNLFINPAVIGRGLSIFAGVEHAMKLRLATARQFDCGIVVHTYRTEGK